MVRATFKTAGYKVCLREEIVDGITCLKMKITRLNGKKLDAGLFVDRRKQVQNYNVMLPGTNKTILHFRDTTLNNGD